MDTTPIIRRASAADLDAIAALEATCFPAAQAATREQFAQRLAHYAHHFLLLFLGDRLVSFVDGFCTDRPDLTDDMYAQAEQHREDGGWQMIFGVNTHPDYRCQGYAGMLLRAFLQEAKDQGRVGLVLTCKPEKVAYYSKFGFRDEGITPDSVHGGVVWHQMRLTIREEKEALVLFPCDEGTRQRLIRTGRGLCRFTFREPDWSREAYHAALARAQIIIGEPRNEDFSHCTRLEWMQSPSSGVNYYMDGGCFPAGAALCCMTGEYGNVLAEHMLAMTLALCRRLPEYRDQQHDHKWELRRYDKQLQGSTVLILGAGDIGTTLATWLRPMVGTVIGMRRVKRPMPEVYDRMITPEELDAYLLQADIVLCALPHTPQTAGLLDERRLSLMKPDAVLVNGGRGSLIDQEALCRLLQAGHFWGVGLEVTKPEPLPPEHPLWDQPRLIITPHAAGNSFAPGSPLEKRIWDRILENVTAYLYGRELKNRVDMTTGYAETR